VDLHYTAADLNRLLHLHLPDHEPITSLVVTYNLIRQAAPQTEDRLPALSNDAPISEGPGDVHPSLQFAHLPGTSAYPQAISSTCFSSHPPSKPQPWDFPYQQYASTSVQSPFFHPIYVPFSETRSSILVSSLDPQSELGGWNSASTIDDASLWAT
jgi:hypothetical protein